MASHIKAPHLKLAKQYWKEHLLPNDVAIDATCGNGHDTLFLKELGATVFALDIQEEAVKKTKELAGEVTILQMSHAFIHQISLPKPPRLIVYNFGYLPGGDKSITTRWETSLESIRLSLGMVEKGGALSILCYPGHDEGKIEEQKITEYLASLPSSGWLICQHRYINRPKSPVLIWVKNFEK